MVLHRDASLPATDIGYLDRVHPNWQLLREGNASWLLLPEFPIPSGYSQSGVTVALRIEPGYPDTALDMVYFSPFVSRKDGQAIGATEARASIGGREFQRWSRHRTAQNPWIPGEDDIQTHLLLVDHWLKREFLK